MKITNIMLSNRLGGIGQAYLDYNEALLELGHTVQGICHYDGGWREATEQQMLRYPRLSMLNVKEKGGPKVLPSLLKIRFAVSKFSPDIIVIHNYVRVGMLATVGIAPQVSITHMFKCKHFEKLNGVIALTDELSTLCEVRGISKDRIRIIPNMINGPFYEPSLRSEQPVVKIGGLGRLDKEKGFSDLIDAMAELVHKGLSVRLLLGGKGFEEESLRLQVQKLGLDKHVEFLGFVTDKQAFFEKIDLFVIPSTEEPFGIVAIEAMKFGIPTVATAVGGLKTIFTDGANALFAEPANPHSLATAIERLIADPILAHDLAYRANLDVQANYSLPVVSKKLDAALLEWAGPTDT